MVFDNTIDDLLVETDKYKMQHGISPIFISDWNPCDENLIYPKLKYNTNWNSNINDFNYLYSINTFDYKSKFKQFCLQNRYNIEFDFTLLANSTIALYLIFKNLNLQDRLNVLAFTPCYFTSESALKSLNASIAFFPLIDNLDDDSTLEQAVIENKISAILITDPIYGNGLALSNKTYKLIVNIAKKHNISLIVDYSYGNMVWKENDHIFNYRLISFLVNSKIDYYLIDSLPKKMFLNGLKFSLLFSNQQNITNLEKLSLFIEGSVSAPQFKNYYRCYDKSNLSTINGIVNKHIERAQGTYKIISSFLLNNELMKILTADAGIFALIGLKRKHSAVNDMDFAKYLIKEMGVFLTPHSRYNFYDDSFFYFRINLLLNQEDLINSLIKLLNL